jgi:hypothetical protein
VQPGVAKAAETIKGIEGVWDKGAKAIIRDNKVAEWRAWR